MSEEFTSEDIDTFVSTCSKIPLMDTLIAHPRTIIYGGLPLYYFSYVLEHKEHPSFENVLNYVLDADIDFKIISTMEKYISGFCKIFNAVRAHKGTMLYMGTDYMNAQETEPIITGPFDPEITVVPEGYYGIWIPYNDSYIHYEIFYGASAAWGIELDYDVNSIHIFTSKHSKYYSINTYNVNDKISLNVIKDSIKKKEYKCGFIHREYYDTYPYYFIKKIMRSLKLNKKGFKCVDPSMPFYIEKCREYLSKRDFDIISSPVVIDHSFYQKNPNIIYPTSFDMNKLTLDKFNEYFPK